MLEYHYFVAHEFNAQQMADLRKAIAEAFKGTGLNAYYADMEVRQKHILEKIKERILETQFGIYDVTNVNPNVCLELGIALGAKRPYYIILKKGTSRPADVEGLDRIEYESYRDLTAKIKDKIVKLEQKRFEEIKEGHKREREYDRLPEESVRNNCIELYKAEELFHRFGSEVDDASAMNNKAWFADLSGMDSNHIIYGPYSPLQKCGDYVAFFRIKTDDNSSDKILLLLEVTGDRKVARTIKGIDFDRPYVYQLFGLKFRIEVTNPMEYRVFNAIQRGKIWIDYVAIVKAEHLYSIFRDKNR